MTTTNRTRKGKTMIITDVCENPDGGYFATVDDKDEVLTPTDAEWTDDWPACQKCGKTNEWDDAKDECVRRVYSSDNNVFICSDCLETLAKS